MDITVNNLTHDFDKQCLFEALSFHVRSGQKVCVAGPSGSGKSTLLKALMGFIVPAEGEIHIGTEPMTPHSVWGLRRKMAYVGQEPDLGEGVVIDRIRRPFTYHANAHLTLDRQTLSDYCRRFQLSEELLHKEIGDLSGGEKQRIALIIALLLKRPILLLDEPVSALDKANKAAVKEELARDASRTILFISHESELLEIADATISLDSGGGRR
jgi:ABC-type iron transport system FetAB ATPase subunit